MGFPNSTKGKRKVKWEILPSSLGLRIAKPARTNMQICEAGMKYVYFLFSQCSENQMTEDIFLGAASQAHHLPFVWFVLFF